MVARTGVKAYSREEGPMPARHRDRRSAVVLSRHFVLVLIAVILQAIIVLALVVPFSLPRGDAWQAAAFLAFFASFL